MKIFGGAGLLFLLLLPQLFYGQITAEDISGRYQFVSITQSGGEDLFAITAADTLQINSDYSFHYHLTAKNNLTATGTWALHMGNLMLNYKQPTDTLRIYKLNSRGDTLVLMENGVLYTLLKYKDQAPAVVSLSEGSFTIKHLLRGFMGLLALVALAFLFSNNKRKINWWLVLKGLLLQFILALAILKVKWVADGFDIVGRGFVAILGFTNEGAKFLFGSLVENTDSFGYIFAFNVLPTVVFFSALTSLLYYFNILQKVVYAFAWLMKHTLRLSGAESLAAAGNIFLGQTEAPLLVKPYIANMTRSELMCLMTGGMATIAGGVLAAYIGYLGGADEASQLFFARHLIAASVMSAPAAIVAAKIMVPEVQKFSDDMHIARHTIGSNWLDAVATGTTDGLRLAINVGAMLLVFTAMIYLFNAILGDVLGHYSGLNAWIEQVTHGQYTKLSFQFILGYALAPLTWLMGVNGTDITLVGQLLGEKTILNEFYAYKTMGEMMTAGTLTESRSLIIATYILCGFSNFASIGIQIGGISALAPTRRSDLSRLGMQALIGGTLASLFTAVIVGMLI